MVMVSFYMQSTFGNESFMREAINSMNYLLIVVLSLSTVMS